MAESLPPEEALERAKRSAEVLTGIADEHRVTRGIDPDRGRERHMKSIPIAGTTEKETRDYYDISISYGCRRLMHNHPSGDPTPSRADIDMTKLIVETAKPLGIAVHDHIIIGKDGHVSLKGLRLF